MRVRKSGSRRCGRNRGLRRPSSMKRHDTARESMPFLAKKGLVMLSKTWYDETVEMNKRQDMGDCRPPCPYAGARTSYTTALLHLRPPLYQPHASFSIGRSDDFLRKAAILGSWYVLIRGSCVYICGVGLLYPAPLFYLSRRAAYLRRWVGLVTASPARLGPTRRGQRKKEERGKSEGKQ